MIGNLATWRRGGRTSVPSGASFVPAILQLLLLLVLLLGGPDAAASAAASGRSAPGSFHVDMIYRYSEAFRSLVRQRGNGALDADADATEAHWPSRPGTAAFYKRVALNDRRRHVAKYSQLLPHRRGLAADDGGYYFSPTNETTSYDAFGMLHYSLIEIGNPPVSFLVALDTGSDLLWVPCECQKCAPLDVSNYSVELSNGQAAFSTYSPASSNTSKIISCGDAICKDPSLASSCTSATANCDYVISYISANTSTSGLVVQDVLHLNANSGGSIATSVYLGCGKVQSGGLLDGVAPNGLMGLGLDSISVPSTLASNGVTAKTFSMCFSDKDSSGRLVFGNVAKDGLQNTSISSGSGAYFLGTSALIVDDQTLNVTGSLIFDTGTAFTRLPNSTLKALGSMLNQRIDLEQTQFEDTLEYCWQVSSTNIELPSLSIMFDGGSIMDVQIPYVSLADSQGNVKLFCLGIIGGGQLGIIGHNFMLGYEFIFDQESMLLSWTLSDCYNTNGSIAKPPSALAISPVPPHVNQSSTPIFSPTQAPINSSPSLSLQTLLMFQITCIVILIRAFSK